MNMHKSQCCAITEIGSLSLHKNDPKGAMVSFCKQNIAQPPRYGTSTANTDSLISFYMFTAACSGKVASDHYGSQFYKFIVDNKLGQVWESPALVNKAFHPDHANQIYIWMPDKKAVEKWWAAYQESIKPVAPIVSPASPVMEAL